MFHAEGETFAFLVYEIENTIRYTIILAVSLILDQQ